MRRDKIEDFRRRRHAQPRAFQQYPAGVPQSFADVAVPVEVGIVDQSLPTHSGPGLLEVNAHDEKQRVGHARREVAQAAGIFQGRFGFVDRAGPYDDEQTVVFTEQNLLKNTTRPGDERRFLVAHGQVFVQLARRRQRFFERDVEIGDFGWHDRDIREGL